MVDSAREMCGSVRVRGMNPKRVWWNDEVKATVERKGAGWKEVFGAKGEVSKERCMVAYKEKIKEKGNKVYIYQIKMKVNDQLEKRMN